MVRPSRDFLHFQRFWMAATVQGLGGDFLGLRTLVRALFLLFNGRLQAPGLLAAVALTLLVVISNDATRDGEAAYGILLGDVDLDPSVSTT